MKHLYIMYSVDIRKIAVNVYFYFKSLRKTSKILNISIASISRWVYNLYPKKRLFNKTKQTDILIDFIKYKLIETPMISSREIVVEINNKFNIKVSRQLISLIIKKTLNYTYKKIKNKCISKDTDVKTSNFIKQFKKLNPDSIIVSIDESGFDKRPKQIYGYGLKGSRLYTNYKNYTVSKYSLLLAISNKGDKTFVIVKDYINSLIFKDFIESLDYPKDTYFLLDNASIHKTKNVINAFKNKGYIPLFIPPYSPQFNPIELTFGIIKTSFYKKRFYKDNFYNSIIESTMSLDKNIIIKCFNHVITNYIYKN